MRFHLSPEQVAIQDAVRGTLADCWGIEQLHAFADSGSQFDYESWQDLMALGVGSLMLKPKFGGSELGLLDAALVCEVSGIAAAPGPLIGQIVTGIAISLSGNQFAQEDWLHGIATGERQATLAFEGLPETWSVSGGTGEIAHVISGGAADLYLVGTAGGGLGLVEGIAADGVSTESLPATDRTRPLARVRFEGAHIEPLFEPGDPIVQRVIDAALVLIAADSLGGAQHCTDLSVEYAKTREQFGQPIARFQALKHQLAQMALDVEPARALVWYAAYAWDAALPDASHAAAQAKALLGEVYTRTTRAAIAAHGGIGYTWEYGLNYWFRRALHNRAWLGSPVQHRARAAELAGW